MKKLSLSTLVALLLVCLTVLVFSVVSRAAVRTNDVSDIVVDAKVPAVYAVFEDVIV